MTGTIEILDSDSYKIQQGTTAQARKELGKKIAELYIAAQNVSQDASTSACEMIQRFDHDILVMWGFNSAMSESIYNVRVSRRND